MIAHGPFISMILPFKMDNIVIFPSYVKRPEDQHHLWMDGYAFFSNQFWWWTWILWMIYEGFSTDLFHPILMESSLPGSYEWPAEPWWLREGLGGSLGTCEASRQHGDGEGQAGEALQAECPTLGDLEEPVSLRDRDWLLNGSVFLEEKEPRVLWIATWGMKVWRCARWECLMMSRVSEILISLELGLHFQDTKYNSRLWSKPWQQLTRLHCITFLAKEEIRLYIHY